MLLYLVLAHVALVAFMPIPTWHDPLPIVSIGLSLLAVVLIWLPSTNPRALRFAAALRDWDLGVQSLWFDESFSVYVAGLPWTKEWEFLVTDGVYPQLFYWIEKFWLGLGGWGY